MKHFNISLLLAGALLTTAVAPQAFAKQEKSTQAHHDSLVGAYSLNWVLESNPNVVRRSNIVFNADGTLVGMGTLDLTAASGISPEGFFGTAATGIWKKTGKRTYQIVWTSVIAKKSPQTTPPSELDYSLPSVPFARFKVVGDVKLCKDSKQIKAHITISAYEPADTTLTQPVPGIGTFVYNIEGTKLGF